MTAWLKDVIGYGTHAARPAAGSAGALYYETDTDTLFRDNGATWDTLTLGSASPLTTKGDVFVHGAGDARLPVGTDGQVLTADSTQALGVKWAAAGGGGSGALTKIADSVLTSAAANIAFSSIPSTYRHLEIMLQARGDTAAGNAEMRMQLNGDTGANYTWEQVLGNANTSAIPSTNQLGDTACRIGYCAAASAPSGYTGAVIIRIPNYAGTTFQKDVLAHGSLKQDTSSSGHFVTQHVGHWLNTVAITNIVLFLAAGNFAAGTVASLYGMG